MEFQEVAKEYRIAGVALAHDGKVHCGDYLRFSEIASEQLVLLALSDGVGSLHHDWAASQIACDSFIESFSSSAIADLQTRFEKAIEDADRAVSDPFDSSMKGMMCTLIAVVWDLKLDEILYCNIGDSRLYQHSANTLVQISNDEKKSVLMRDKGGKLLSNSGSLIVREGLTNALGYNGAKINVEKQSFGFGDALVLSTDGMYELPGFNDGVIEILQHIDFEKAAEKFVRQNRGIFKDDASILILVRTFLPDSIRSQIMNVINQDLNSAKLNFPIHLITSCIVDEIKKMISKKDGLGLERMIDLIQQNGLRLSESFIENSISEMKTIGFFNSKFYQLLIEHLKKLRW